MAISDLMLVFVGVSLILPESFSYSKNGKIRGKKGKKLKKQLRINPFGEEKNLFLCLVLVEPKAPCYRAHVCVRNSGFSRILSPTTRDHFRAMFV